MNRSSLGLEREDDPKDDPLLVVIQNTNGASVIIHDLPHDREAKARRSFFRRIKRQKDFFSLLGRYAFAMIADFDNDLPSPASGRHTDGVVIRGSVDGVKQKIDYDLFYPNTVEGELRQISREMCLERDVLSSGIISDEFKAIVDDRLNALL